MEDQQAAVAEAFSRKAQVYDAFGVDHVNLERMRQKVRRSVLRYLHPGDRILELNAGSGGDAAYFAGLGYRVHATDLSPGMTVEIAAKVARLGLHEHLTVQRLDFNHLEEVTPGPYACVFSNMGGVNCTGNLARVAQGVAGVLAPGGVVVWVVMPRVCLWELAAGLRGDWRTAARRLRPGGVRAQVEGVAFTTWYYDPAAVQAAFGPAFKRVRLEGLSVFTPPADYKAFPGKRPRLYRLLRRLDDRLADRTPFNRWGDFYILTLRRRSAA